MKKQTVCTTYSYKHGSYIVRVLDYDGLFYFCANDILKPTGITITPARIKRLYLDGTWFWYPRPWHVEIDGEKLLFLDDREVLEVLAFNNRTAVDNGFSMRDCLINLLDDFRWDEEHVDGNGIIPPMGALVSPKKQYAFNDRLLPTNGYNRKVMKGWLYDPQLNKT